MAKLVSKTYGEALYEIAMESGEGKALELMEEIRCVNQVLEQNPQFDELMKHPGIPKQDKLHVVEDVFQGRVSDELAGLLKIVVSKERYRDLPDMAKGRHLHWRQSCCSPAGIRKWNCIMMWIPRSSEG